MKHILDPAEKWLAKQYLDPGEYNAFLRGQELDFLRTEIKKRIFNEIRNFISKSNQNSPPFNPEKIMGYRKIRKIVWDKKLKFRESLLIPIADGFIININPNKPDTRLRFSIAHEIGHTYFFDLNTSPPQRSYHVSSSRTWVEEGYACEIAREILMPEPYISKAASKFIEAPSQVLLELKKSFCVSYEVLIMRLLHDAHLWNYEFWKNSLWDGIVIIAKLPFLGESHALQMKVYRSPAFKYKFKDIRHNEKIKEEIMDILKNNAHIDKRINIGKRKTQYRIHGLPVGKRANIAILTLMKT